MQTREHRWRHQFLRSCIGQDLRLRLHRLASQQREGGGVMRRGRSPRTPIRYLMCFIIKTPVSWTEALYSKGISCSGKTSDMMTLHVILGHFCHGQHATIQLAEFTNNCQELLPKRLPVSLSNRWQRPGSIAILTFSPISPRKSLAALTLVIAPPALTVTMVDSPSSSTE